MARASDVSAGCYVPCCQYRYSGDSVRLEMEVELKVGCPRSVVCMTTYMTGVWCIRVEYFGGDRACQTFRYHSQLSSKAYNSGDAHMFDINLPGM
jgi:hypothetical protein